MKRRGSLLGVMGLLVIIAWSPDAGAHTKGLTLSGFGLIDVSLQANVDYVNFSDPKRVDFDKIGDRQEKGFNLTSFDLSLSGETAEFPLKFAMFLTFEQDRVIVEAQRPEAMPLDVVYEDEDMIVLDKPAGLVVHPAPGNLDGTLVNALLAHCGPSFTGIGAERRPGIVHRLDKDTSGVMVVVMLLVTAGVKSGTNPGTGRDVLQLLAGGGAGLVAFVIAARVLRVRDLAFFRDLLPARFRRV